MNPFGDRRAQLAAKLTAAGVEHVTTDPANIPPFVLVGLVTTTAAEGIGAWAATVPITVAVPPPGDAAAAAAMETAVAAVYAALGFAPARPTTYTANTDTPLPAYQLVYPVSILNPNC